MEVYMDEISNIKFNLTPLMADEIVKINDLKIKIFKLDQEISKKPDEKLTRKKEILVKKMESEKKKFIKEFQNNNKDQIMTYLNLKNKEN